MNFVHIGFGKTATTTLQNFIIPELSKELRIYYNREEYKKKIYPIVLSWKSNTQNDREIKKLNLKNTIISFENLIGANYWNPNTYNHYFNLNKKLFNSDDTIIITLRSPEKWLTSIFVESLHCMDIKKPENFFLSDKDYKNKNLNEKKWSPQKFSYTEVINLYKKYFKNVHYLKLEDPNYVANFIKILGSNNYEKYQKIFKNTYYNQSTSEISVKLTFILEKIFKKFDKSLADTHIDGVLKSEAKNKNIINKLIRWRWWQKHLIDKYLGKKKFKIDFTSLDIDLTRLIREYNNL